MTFSVPGEDVFSCYAKDSDLAEKMNPSPSEASLECSSEAISVPWSPLARLRKSRSWRVAMAVLAAIAMGLSSYYVVSKLLAAAHEIAQSSLDVHLGFVGLSFAMTFGCVLLGGIIWYLVLEGLGGMLEVRACVCSHLLANLGGYLPGYGWKFVGKAYLTQRQGVSGGQTSFAVLVEFAGSALTRAVVALTTVPPAFMERLGLGAEVSVRWLCLASWIAMLLFPWAVEKVVAWGKRSHRFPLKGLTVNKSALWLALLAMCLTWVLYGLGFSVLLRSVYHIQPDQVIAALFSTTASFLTSLLMFFVPAGLGVREGVVIYTLGSAMPEAVVTIGALLSRLVLIMAEISSVVVGALTYYKGLERGIPCLSVAVWG